MIPDDIKWNRELSRKAQFRSTWGVEINGASRIVKRIETKDKDKLNALAERLKKQVHFTGSQNPEEQKSICLFDDMFEGKDFIAFYRKYRPGASLDSLISRKRFKPSEAVKICLETARVLQIAHAKRLYHGDLNPRNIIVGEGGAIAILDWDNTIICDGIQEELLGRDAIREDVGASPEYMPPEQFRGEKLQPQMDVYALGVILYQMLCGHTPFDSIDSRRPLEMGRYKEKNEPDGIRKAHPELAAIPDALDGLIVQSLKKDLNQRIPSVDDFIQRLLEIRFDPESDVPQTPVHTLPQDDSNTVPGIGPASLPSTTNETEYKLLLIGHKGAGKTVLAAGLHATSDRDFMVDEPGGRTRTGAYVFNLKNEFGKKKWPSATSINDIIRISCSINYKGRRKRIAFDDYAGERLGTDYFNSTIFSNPDGAFILLNPGGPQWHIPEEKNRMISDLKFYIDLLARQPNRPPVALVITASDRLDSDLRGFLPVFERSVKELENYLIGRKCLHRTFRVSVSGRLSNQNLPELRPKNVSEPFIWMMECFDATGWHRQLKRIAAAAAAVAAALLVALVGELCREAHIASSLKNRFQEIEKSFSGKTAKTKQDRLTHVMELIELRNRFCSEDHFSNTARLGECSSACKPSFYLSSIGVSSFKNEFDKSIAILESAIDSANFGYLSADLDDAIRNPTMENRKVPGRIKKWNTLRPENDRMRRELLRICDDEMLPAMEVFDQKILEKELLAVIDAPDTTFPSSLDVSLRDWIGLDSKRPETERAEAVETMKALELKARRTVENRRFKSLLAGLEGVDDSMPRNLLQQLDEWNHDPTFLAAAERQELDQQLRAAAQNAANRVFEKACGKQKNVLDSFRGSSVDELEKLAKDYLTFWQKIVPGVEPALRKRRQDELDQKFSQIVADFARAKQDEAREELIAGETYRDPAYAEEVKSKVVSLFQKDDSGLARKLNDGIDGVVSEGKKEWDGIRKQEVESFLAGLRDAPISEALDQFKEFSLGNSANPFLDDAENGFVGIVEEQLAKTILDFDAGGTEDDYRAMNGVAAKIRSSTSRKLKGTWMDRFANDFFEMMKTDEPVLTVTDIQVSTGLPKGAYIEKCSYAVGDGTPVVLIENLKRDQEKEATFKDATTTLPFFREFSVPCAPWEDVKISFDLLKVNTLIDSKKPKVLTFRPGRTKGDSVNFESADLVFTIYFQVNFKKISDILSEVGKNDASEETRAVEERPEPTAD